MRRPLQEWCRGRVGQQESFPLACQTSRMRMQKILESVSVSVQVTCERGATDTPQTHTKKTVLACTSEDEPVSRHKPSKTHHVAVFWHRCAPCCHCVRERTPTRDHEACRWCEESGGREFDSPVEVSTPSAVLHISAFLRWTSRCGAHGSAWAQ